MTRVYGVLGTSLEHSLSPAIHRAAFAELGMDAAYLPFEIADDAFARALTGSRTLGIVGLNVTLPFKEAAAEAADTLTARAKLSGAANALALHANGRVEGDNTDGAAVRWALADAGHEPAGKAALLIGAGGVARGVAFALAEAGAKIRLCGRTEARAARLVAALADAGFTADLVPWRERFWAVGEASVVVQATPLGGGPKGKGSPLGRDTEAALWAPGAALVELAYGPRATPLSVAASARGVMVIDGVDILCRQAALSWDLWFGLRGPLPAMRRGAAQATATADEPEEEPS